ncbi:MAG: cell division protein ZapB [Candidatus Dependentiae bacterium]|nr:cell division protein ZapB [Candidatus Dependentiae bacterium]
MEVLSVLEQKIVSLVEFVEKLHKQNELLRSESEALHKEIVELRAENAHFVEENMHITAKLHDITFCAQAESKELSELHLEKKYTKQVVDDLIKSIESLVEKENQL